MSKSKSSNKNVLFISLIVVLIVLLVYVVIVPMNSDYKVRFGSILWLSGKYKSYGEQFKKGALLAVDQINKKKNNELEILFSDSEAKKEEAIKHLKLFHERDNINFIVEIMGSEIALHTIPYINENKILFLSGVNTGPDFTSLGGDYFYRIIPSDGEAAKQLVKISNDIFDTKNAALIYATDTWGNGLRTVLEEIFRNNSGELTLVKGVRVDETIYEPIISQLKDINPEVTFLILYPKDAALLLKEAGRQSIKTKFMGTDNFTGSEVYEVGGEGVNGVLFVLPSETQDVENSEKYLEFLEIYQQQYGADSKPELFTKNAYDCVNLMYETYVASKGNTQKAREYLNEVSYNGVTGIIEFDQYNDIKSKDYELWEYKWDSSLNTATADKYQQ